MLAARLLALAAVAYRVAVPMVEDLASAEAQSAGDVRLDYQVAMAEGNDARSRELSASLETLEKKVPLLAQTDIENPAYVMCPASDAKSIVYYSEATPLQGSAAVVVWRHMGLGPIVQYGPSCTGNRKTGWRNDVGDAYPISTGQVKSIAELSRCAKWAEGRSTSNSSSIGHSNGTFTWMGALAWNHQIVDGSHREMDDKFRASLRNLGHQDEWTELQMVPIAVLISGTKAVKIPENSPIHR